VLQQLFKQGWMAEVERYDFLFYRLSLRFIHARCVNGQGHRKCLPHILKLKALEGATLCRFFSVIKAASYTSFRKKSKDLGLLRMPENKYRHPRVPVFIAIYFYFFSSAEPLIKASTTVGS